MRNSDYSFADRLLHRIALKFGPLAELSFDMDQAASKAAVDSAAVKSGQHVFVSGLARSGTTILMRRLFASDQFTSLTYRNMPFVLAPGYWTRITGQTKGDPAPKERAHGDGILVNADSPEALDEVFWRVFDGASYIRKTQIQPHQPDGDLVDQFVSYVGAILAADSKQTGRYLSKNNNNILRLGTLSKAFPNALFLIPVRNPATHVESLMSQHNRFIEQQVNDPFVRTYMQSLAHHEFGGDHRPFIFGKDDRVIEMDTKTPDYWLELWIAAYTWLKETAPPNSMFVNYEALCSDPDVWQNIAEASGVAASTSANETFALPSKPSLPDLNASRLDIAMDLYHSIGR